MFNILHPCKILFTSLLRRGCIGVVGFIFIFLLCPLEAYSAKLALSWQPSLDSDMSGYRLFCRQGGESYDYSNPVWEGTGTTCTYEFDAVVNTTYCFVVKAFDTPGNESSDSNEACWTAPAFLLESLSITGPASVNEGDTASYIATATFSNGDTGEATNTAVWHVEPATYASIRSGQLTTWGVPSHEVVTINASYTFGNVTKQAQKKVVTIVDVGTDDTDGDGLPDWWESAHGLDPNSASGINGRDGDFDHDGWSNYEEYVSGTDPADDNALECFLNLDIFEQATLDEGVEYYRDRSYTLSSVPSQCIYMDMIETANNDKHEDLESGYLTFEMPFDGTVYVAFDTRAASVPNWMSSFSDTGDEIDTTDVPLQVYEKQYDAGECVDLGGNSAPGSAWPAGKSNYVVFYGLGSEDLITNISVSNSNTYEKDTLAVGELVYIDRSYTFTSMPNIFEGQQFIRTANTGDKWATEADFLQFELTSRATVYVAYDIRATAFPGWLGSWTDTGMTIGTTDVMRQVYEKDFAAGPVTLGGNAMAPMQGAESNYNVIVIALP
jgi:hypothetical protein